MKILTGVTAIAIAAAATGALAHNGAVGVVLERMNGMTVIRDLMRDLSPMMQGSEPYDPIQVSEAGYVIASHAGDTMRALFPKGSLEGVTYAKPNIWSEWEEFPRGDALQGAYLARASGCVSCHTNFEGGGAALAGGAPLDTPFGTFVPPNITPHSDGGIGRWTIQDFAKAIRQGISPDGDPYYPVFTYSFNTTFDDQQISDLWEAFRNVPALAQPAPEHEVSFPFSFRGGLKLWRANYLDVPNTAALMGTSDAWNRGRQIVEGAAYCAACHTGRNIAGGLKNDETFAGNDDLPGGSKAPSIRADDLVRNGWTEDNLAFALRLGILPSGDAFGGSMAEVVTYGTAYLTDADRAAIATYLLDPDGTGAPAEQLTEAPLRGGTVDHSAMEMVQN